MTISSASCILAHTKYGRLHKARKYGSAKAVSATRPLPASRRSRFPNRRRDKSAAIAEAARELDTLRNAWLNPPEWTREETLTFPGSVEGPWARYVQEADGRGIGTVRYPRTVAKDAESAALLAKRTLTGLYNARPAWLERAHRRLDAAVFEAYGWTAELGDDEVLGRLGAEFGAGGDV